MSKNIKCILCKNEIIIKRKSQAAPFISERIKCTIEDLRMCYCNKCDFIFFNPRLTDDKLALVYKGYRDKEYQMDREKYEPWYTKEVNESIGGNVIIMQKRKENLWNFIKPYENEVRTVFDYGGDKGQFIPDQFSNRERYVYEISDVRPLNGIRSISKIDYSNKYDFIMCCQVLEHVPDPNQIIGKIKKLCHEKSYVYFELPFDSPINSNSPSLIKSFMKKTTLYKVFRLMTGKKMEMHEHINFFTEKTLKIAMKLNGFKLLRLEKINLGDAKVPIPTICCLVKY